MLPRIFCLVSSRDDLSVLGEIALAGVQGFQVRDPELTTVALLDLTHRVIEAVRPHGATVVVNDRLDVALAAGADGVHLGSTDLPVAAARTMAPELLIGATCRDRDTVVAAGVAGASYAGFGPVFATASKQGLPQPRGLDGVRDASGVLPLVGIAGVDATNAADVIGAGAEAVAVIGGIWRQPDPVQAAKELVTAVG